MLPADGTLDSSVRYVLPQFGRANLSPTIGTNRKQVNRLMLVEEVEHRVENNPVLVRVKRIRRNCIRHIIQRFGTEHDRAEKSHLRLEVLRRHSQSGFIIEEVIILRMSPFYTPAFFRATSQSL